MPQYQIDVTGEGIKSMFLTFDDFGKYQDWSLQVTKIRSTAGTILQQKYEESINISLYHSYLPLVENMVQEFGIDFVPSDIKDNLETARQLLVQLPPNPIIVHSLRKHLHDVITDELLIALYHENEEVHVAINRENGECINPECKNGECNANELDQGNEQPEPLFSDDVPFEWPTQKDEPEPLFSDDEKITDEELRIALDHENEEN